MRKLTVKVALGVLFATVLFGWVAWFFGIFYIAAWFGDLGFLAVFVYLFVTGGLLMLSAVVYEKYFDR